MPMKRPEHNGMTLHWEPNMIAWDATRPETDTQKAIRRCMNRAENRYEIASRHMLVRDDKVYIHYAAKAKLRAWRDAWIEYLQGEYHAHGG